MLTLSLDDIPCFSDSAETEISFKKVNFIFGANGSGKSSLCRKVADTLAQSKDEPTKVLLYNRQYRDGVVSSSDSLDGHVAVGPEAVEAKRKISELKRDLEKLRDKESKQSEQLNGNSEGSEGHKNAIERIEREILDLLWQYRSSAVKRSAIKDLFPGTAGSKARFYEVFTPMVQKELTSPFVGPIEDLADLGETFGNLKDFQGEQLHPFQIPDSTMETLQELQALSGLLSKAVIDNSQSDYSADAKRVGDSAWLSKGFELLAITSPHCPFCTQEIEKQKLDEINSFFQSQYEVTISRLRLGLTASRSCESDLRSLAAGLPDDSPVSNVEVRQALIRLADQLHDFSQLLERKLASPKQVLGDASLIQNMNLLNSATSGYNSQVVAFNTQLKTRQQLLKQMQTRAQTALLSPLWDYDRKNYVNLCKARDSTEQRLAETVKNISEVERKISDAARDARDAKVAVDWMNSLIRFLIGDSFHLEEISTDSSGHGYKVVRRDGSPAGSSLSEGEEQLLAFLYFISSVRNVGQEGNEAPERECVVIVDDPMSSLDSELLYGVSTILNDVIWGMKDGTWKIKQFFCCSHNSAFYRNLTYSFRHSDGRYQHFFIRKGPFGHHSIEPVSESPVSTTYKELWRSIAKAGESSDSVGLANTMRRILENYFQTDNHLSQLRQLRDIGSKDRIAFNTLVNWSHDGSHNLFDTLEVGTHALVNESLLRVFEHLFRSTGHAAHYEMMMESTSDKSGV